MLVGLYLCCNIFEWILYSCTRWSEKSSRNVSYNASTSAKARDFRLKSWKCYDSIQFSIYFMYCFRTCVMLKYNHTQIELETIRMYVFYLLSSEWVWWQFICCCFWRWWLLKQWWACGRSRQITAADCITARTGWFNIIMSDWQTFVSYYGHIHWCAKALSFTLYILSRCVYFMDGVLFSWPLKTTKLTHLFVYSANVNSRRYVA